MENKKKRTKKDIPVIKKRRDLPSNGNVKPQLGSEEEQSNCKHTYLRQLGNVHTNLLAVTWHHGFRL